jgi:hypothetical protein
VSHRSRIKLLVIASVVAVILCSGWSAVVTPRGVPFTSYLPVVTMLALVLSQAYFLGFWTALSEASPGTRLVWLGLGTLALEGLFALAAGNEGERLVATTVSIGTAGALVAARGGGVRLHRFAGPMPPPPPTSTPQGLRVSIRTLMVVTLVVALLTAGARSLRELTPLMPLYQVLLMAVFGLCSVALDLTASWAVLGSARPWNRGPILVLLTPILGTYFWYCVGSPPIDIYWNITVCLSIQTILVFGSLLVLRSCGFRFVEAWAAPQNLVQS